MALNLDPIAKVAETFMVDAISITRTEDTDKVWNPVTGTYTNASRTIYAGKAFISPMGTPSDQVYGGEEVHRIYYEIGAPRSMPETKVNDKINVTFCKYDPQLVGRVLCVEGIIPGTFTVHRRITAYFDQSGS